jgi:gamma-glutamylputrescine oxidase
MALLDTDLSLARDSYYAATAPRGADRPALQGRIEADVAIVGGGLAGLSAALELAERGRRVVLLEARQVGSGASGRNGGQAIHGLACSMGQIEAQLGLDEARRIFAMSIDALALIRSRCARHGIDCDWRDGFLGVAVQEGKARGLYDDAERLERLYGWQQRPIERADLPNWIASPRVRGAVYDARSGHLHPLKYTLGLARAAEQAGAQLFEHSPVTALVEGPEPVLRTTQGEVHARQVLLAGNVYLQGLVPALQARIMPVGTYIVGSEALTPERARALIPCGAAVCDNNWVLDYYRLSADHRMLYGGRATYSTLTPLRMAEGLRQRMVQTFPQLQGVAVAYAWGGFVDVSMNRAPDFGRLPARGHVANVYYLQGFSGHGLALTGLAGQLVAQAMAGDAERFDTFARLRHRPFPGGAHLRTPLLVLGMAWYRLRDSFW